MAAEWNKTSCFIPLESKVTVYGVLAGEEVNMDSFWAVITDVTIYEVTGAQGKKTQHIEITSMSSKKTQCSIWSCHR